MGTPHRVVVVEDLADAREYVCAILRLRGDEPVAAGTVEEALPLLETGYACYYVFDQQLPLNATSVGAAITGGERVIETVRGVDNRHNGTCHVTPILALTGASEKPAFVSGLFKLGIDAFVQKPLSDNLATFQNEIREMLARAGRADHAACAALLRRGTTAVADAAAQITIDGTVTTRGRTEIAINGVRREMQDGKLLVVLRSIVARGQSEGGWSSRDALGIGADRAATARIRETFAGIVPDGVDVLEGDRRGNFRLSPSVVVAAVSWDALAAHPHDGVRKLAVAERRRQEAR
jgi:CheY-like chemotaxis protein